jgi:hypothetical protein
MMKRKRNNSRESARTTIASIKRETQQPRLRRQSAMMGETKSRRSPNNLQLALRKCKALIVGPARDSTVEKASAVVRPFINRFLILPATDPGRERLRGLA